MTTSDVVRLATKWVFGLWMAGLGTYMLVEKIAIWPAIGILVFGVFILNPNDLTRFTLWFKTNAAGYMLETGGRRKDDPDDRPPSTPQG